MVYCVGSRLATYPPRENKPMQSGIHLRTSLGGKVGATPTKAYFGRIWPNGNFSMGLGPEVQAALEMEGDDYETQARWGAAGDLAAAVAALTSSNAPNSHSEADELPRRGLKGITGYGQQMLRSGCYLLERDYGNSDLCFATLTVPSLTRQGRVKLAQSWSELTRQFLQWVSRQLMKSGRPTKVCGCVEIQTARLSARGEGYLHLHAVWPSHSNSADRRWAVEWEDLRDWWESALERFSGEKLPHHPRVEVAPVRKSAERYMGKYLSKGSGEALTEFIDDLGEDSVPTAWWFATSDLKSQIKTETARGKNTGTLLDAVIQQCFREGDLTPFEWIRHVEYQHGDRAITVGWCGRLKPRWRDDLLSMMTPLIIPELSDLTGGV